MRVRTAYVAQLQQLHDEINDMAGQVTEAYEHACKAATTGDVPASWPLESDASDISAKEREIETMALRLLLLQQPTAKDLRTVSGALKMVTDLKRIGELSIDVCRLVVDMQGACFEIQGTELADMTEHAGAMVTMSIEAYMTEDMERASKIASMDDTVDDDLDAIRDQLAQCVTDDEMDPADEADLLMIAKNFERIADHAEHISVWTEYVVLGTCNGEPMTLER